MLVRALNLVFRLIGEGTSDTWRDSRSIIGIAKTIKVVVAVCRSRITRKLTRGGRW